MHKIHDAQLRLPSQSSLPFHLAFLFFLLGKQILDLVLFGHCGVHHPSRVFGKAPALCGQSRIAALCTDTLLIVIPCIQADIDLVVPHQTTFAHYPTLILRVVARLEHNL